MTDAAPVVDVYPCRSFVRVRPFTEDEAIVCPGDSRVPRETLVWDGHDTLTVLDAHDNFAPRRNGVFAVGNVLWSFRDDAVPHVPITSQADVYRRVVAPALPAILDGLDVAFCVAGAAGSGRCHTLYGPSVDGEERGLLPRFADELFDLLDRRANRDSTMLVELEAVDVSGETYVDLMAMRSSHHTPSSPHAHGAARGLSHAFGTNVSRGSLSSGTIPTAAADEALKVHMVEGEVRLQNVTQVELKGAADFRTVLRQLMRTVTKRNTTHTIRLRLTETFEFDNVENVNQPIRKSRRSQVAFMLLRNMPSAFQRCVDVAVEHDSGENPLAKVPVRETAFTKLFPELLQQGCILNIISCLSPYYEHARESMHTLQFACKVRRLKAMPRVHEDESLVQMRRLADEVRNLKDTEKKQNAAIATVQHEINSREAELMRQEQQHALAVQEVEEEQNAVRLAAIAVNVQRAKTQHYRHATAKELTHVSAVVAKQRRELAEQEASLGESTRTLEQTRARVEQLRHDAAEQQSMIQLCEVSMKEHQCLVDQLAAVEAFNASSPEEQKRLIVEECAEVCALEAELAKVRAETAAVQAETQQMESDIAALQTDYDAVCEEEQPCRERDEMVQEKAQLEAEIEQMQRDTQRMLEEISARGAKQSSCSVM